MGTAAITVTAGNFKEQLEKPGIVLLDWWATWCPPCRAFAPVFEAAAEKNPDITFGKINTDEEQELSAAFDISSIPTLMIFRDGILLFAQPGAIPGSALGELIQKTRDLDMDEVRKEIAEQQAKRGSETPET
jgi:thioredoxin 1